MDNILEEISKVVAQYDPELFKNEEEEGEVDISIDSYQNAVDAVSDPEDLNFSMRSYDDEVFDDMEVIPIPQKDYEENPIKEGDRVLKIDRDTVIGTVKAIGELVEIEWDAGFTSLEYPEELIHAEEQEEELDKVTSLSTDPPIPVIDQN